MKFLTFLLALFILSHSGIGLAAGPLTLKDFLKAVESQSPELQMENSLKAEASAKAEGIRLPPPMVGVMSMKEGDLRNQGIEISQEIPFPTKISKDWEMRNLESKAQAASFQFRRNEILLQARSAYFEFWQASEKYRILKEKSEFLGSHLKLSRSTARYESASQVHLLGMESELDLLENEILTAQSNFLEARNALKTYAPELSVDEAVAQEPTMEDLQISPQLKSPLVEWKENELKAAQAVQSLKKQEFLPDFFVRYRGYNGNEMTPKSEELMLGITLPFVYFWQPQASSKEAAARAQRADADLRKTQIETENRVSALSPKLEALKKQLSILQKKLIPRAHQRMRFVNSLSQRSLESLDEHRAVMFDYLDLQMKEIETRMEYEKTFAEISKLANQEVRP